MKKLSVYVAITLMLAVCVAFASNKRSWPFSAPKVNGTGSVNSPEQGNIIFDVLSGTAGLFKGYDGSAWITLGGSGGGGNPAGTIIAFAGDLANIPAGYLPCDGSPQSRTTYTDLFNAIGEAWGEGDGTNTFNVPDLRGRFMRGITGATSNDPDAAGRTASNSGGNTGNNVGSLQSDEFKSHSHGIETVYNNGVGAGTYISAFAPNTPRNDKTTAAAGGSESRPKNVYVNYIIKY